MQAIQNIRGQIKALGFSSLPLGLLFFLATTAHATTAIVAVRDVDTPNSLPSVIHVGGLTENVSGFVDRGDNQNWISVPESLEGADYIESAQKNANVSDDRDPPFDTLLIEVDVAEGAVLYMFIIERSLIGTVLVTPFPWMNVAGSGADWVDTGLDISWTRDDRIFNIWRTVGPLATGTYNFKQQPVDASFYGIAATFTTLPLTIDIKPGSDPNGVNPRGKVVIPVAVLGSVDFVATQVDFSTAEFGPGKASPIHDGHVEDVNNDGIFDMVFHFKTQDTGIACGDNGATLSGETFVGDSISGTDSVKTIGCR